MIRSVLSVFSVFRYRRMTNVKMNPPCLIFILFIYLIYNTIFYYVRYLYYLVLLLLVVISPSSVKRRDVSWYVRSHLERLFHYKRVYTSSTRSLGVPIAPLSQKPSICYSPFRNSALHGLLKFLVVLITQTTPYSLPHLSSFTLYISRPPYPRLVHLGNR